MTRRTQEQTTHFQKKLQYAARRRVFAIVLCSVILFIVSQYAVTLASNERNAGLHLEQLADSLSAIDAQSRSFLQDLEDEGVTQDEDRVLEVPGGVRHREPDPHHRRGHEHSLYVVRRIAAQLLSGQL